MKKNDEQEISMGQVGFDDIDSILEDLDFEDKTESQLSEGEVDPHEAILGMAIDELELSVRPFNCLKRAGINTVRELCNK